MAVTARSKEEVPDYQMIFAPPSGHYGAGGYSRGSGGVAILEERTWVPGKKPWGWVRSG